MAYILGSKSGKYSIKGKLTKTTRKVRAVRVGSRTLYKDDSGQLWAKIFNKWWKFPEQIEY